MATRSVRNDRNRRTLKVSRDDLEALLELGEELTAPRCPECHALSELRTGEVSYRPGHCETVTHRVCPRCLTYVSHPTNLKEILTGSSKDEHGIL